MFDLLIKNAKIVDGTGLPSFTGDIAIEDGIIVDSGTPDQLIKKHGRKNLEEVFLELVRNKNEL